MEQKFHIAWEQVPEKEKELAQRLAEFSPFGDGTIKIVSVRSLGGFPSDQTALTYIAIHSNYKVEMTPLVIGKITDKKLLDYIIEKFEFDKNTGKYSKHFLDKWIKCAKEQIKKIL